MSEWKGLWKCEKCGKSGSEFWRYEVTRRGFHYLSETEVCRGRIVPHDRRAPDPEKAELVALLGRAKKCILWPELQDTQIIRETVDAITAAEHHYEEAP